LSSTYKI